MFHIKTDIRQFKCETAEKVERLIRNWVIRPSDLIYNAQQETWNPIGQHPAFDDIFAGIEKEEANEPDTIVTEAPSEVAAEHEVEPGTELEANAATVGAAGATVVVEPQDTTLAADSEEITNVTEAPEAAPEDEITDVREDPRRDTDEQDGVDACAPAPPEPSDEVEGLIRDSDEITMMTDKTFEMLSEERKKEGVSSDPATPDDSETDAGEASIEINEQALTETPEESCDEEDREASDEDEQGKSSGGGRHGLPEEVFVTDEIPRQDVQQAVLDDLSELREDGEFADEDDEDDEVTELIDRDAENETEDGDERKSRWRIVMSDDLDDDEFDAEDLVGSQDAAESTDADASDDERAEATSDDAGQEPEAHADSADEQPADDQPVDDSSSDDDELDEMLDEAAELVGLCEDSEPVDIDGGALEPVEQDEVRERADTPVRAVPEPKEFVSEGYKLPLPVDISPSPEDIRLGLEHSRVGKALKDITFPYPRPKMRDEVTRREYDLDPEEPADHSLLIVAAFVIGVLIVVLAAVDVFG